MGLPASRNLAGKQLNEEGKASRECVVVRVEHEDEISNASAVLLETCRGERRGGVVVPGVLWWRRNGLNWEDPRMLGHIG